MIFIEKFVLSVFNTPEHQDLVYQYNKETNDDYNPGGRIAKPRGSDHKDRKKDVQKLLKDFFGEENPNLKNNDPIFYNEDTYQYEASFTIVNNGQYLGLKYDLDI